MEIVKRIDSNADNLLSAGKLMPNCQHLKKKKQSQTERMKGEAPFAVVFIHRRDHAVDTARLQKVCSGRRKRAVP